MSKIGRKPINTAGVTVTIEGNEVHFKGPKASGVYELPSTFIAEQSGEELSLKCEKESKTSGMEWGLHRALLANKIQGARAEFEKPVTIIGLGFKAAQSGKDLNLSLGYSHKISYPLPEGVTVTIDKTGQNLVFKSSDKELLGQVCGTIRAFRPQEPYKGTGIKVAGQEIIRKAGKTKA
jgi:large subunit ribosomal protein L6